MAYSKTYTAKKPFKLDCGHEVKAGDEFIVTKTFTCREDAKRMAVKQALTPPTAK